MTMSIANTPFMTGDTDPAPAVIRVKNVLRVPVVSADPASGDDGEIVYDQVLDKFRVRMNKAWADIDGNGSGGANYFSPIDAYLTGSGDFLGNYTAGSRYMALAEVTILGVRFRRWTNAATITGEVWIGGTSVASKDLAVDPGLGPTTFEVMFDTPVTVPKNSEFFCTSYDGGTRYAQTDRLAWDANFQYGLTMPFSAEIVLLHPGWYRGGHGQPFSASDSHSYPVEPIT
jgi:hypothetical protein